MREKNALKSTVVLIWGATIALVLALAASAYIIRQESLESGRESALSYARFSAEHVGSVLQAADLTAAAIADFLVRLRQDPSSLADQSQALVRQELANSLKNYRVRLPGDAEVILADAEGRVIVSSEDAKGMDHVASRPFFAELRRGSPGCIAISEAFRNASGTDMVMVVGRRLQNEEGDFAGIVGVVLDVDEQFLSFHSGSALPPEATVSVYGQDHRLLTRFPQQEERIGKPAPTEIVRELLRNHRIEGTIMAVSAVDNLMRLFAVSDVMRYPASVVVSLAERQILAYSRSFAHYALGGAFTAILLAGLLTFLAIRKHQVEMALSEERLRRISDLNEITAAVPGVIFSFRLDPDGGMSFPYASERVVEFYGIAPAAIAASAAPIFDSVHPDDLPDFKHSIEISARDLSPWVGKWRYRHPCGTWRWMAGHALPHREVDGCILWHGYVSDITERQDAEDLETENNALVKAAQDSLMAHVAVLDRDGVIVSVNEGWVQFAEENRREAGVDVANAGIGTNYLQICQGAAGPCSEEAVLVNHGIRSVLEGREASFQTIYPCHSPREERWFQMNVAPLRTAKGGAVVSHVNISRLIHAEDALRESEQHYRTLANSGSALIWTSGLDMGCTYFNDGWLKFTGRTLEQELGNGWTEGVHPEDYERCFAVYADAFGKRRPFSMDYRLRTASGAYRWIQDDGVPRFDTEGVFLGYLGNCLDISDRKEAEVALRKLSLAVEQSPVSVVVTDHSGLIEYVNQAFEVTTGYSRDEVMGRNPRLLQSGRTPASVYQAMWTAVSSGQVWKGEFTNRRKDGSEFIEAVTISPVREADGTISHYLAVKQDITEKRQAEAEITRLSYYDSLTGLANRPLLMDRLGHALAALRREDRQGALLMFDIDRFKNFNDARGHELGDALLIALAERIKTLLRDGDTLARLSGDEFAVLLHDITPHRETAGRRALSVAEKIHLALEKPFILDDDEANITASIGITLVPENESDNPLEAFRRSDTALHRAKEAGGHQTAFFETQMGDMAQQRFRIERELRQGLRADQLRLFLQPQVDATGRPVSAEALVRWQHPEKGLVPPAQFIPVAEESDLIVDLGVWVMSEACRLLSQEEMADCPVRISVNVSPRHFRQAGFVSWLRDLLISSGADPNRLTLEVTEGLVIDNINDVVAKMGELAAMGIHFSIDDFGTGYSSLSYLKRLPIHELKIDKSFIQDLPADRDDAALVEAILAVAGHLNLQVVAEGVETRAQADFLNARAAVIHQGYFYGRPEPAEEWLRKRRIGQLPPAG